MTPRPNKSLKQSCTEAMDATCDWVIAKSVNFKPSPDPDAEQNLRQLRIRAGSIIAGTAVGIIVLIITAMSGLAALSPIIFGLLPSCASGTLASWWITRRAQSRGLL